jgi:hypothetical protein
MRPAHPKIIHTKIPETLAAVAAEAEVEVEVLACEPPQVPSGGLPIMRLAAPAQPSQKPWPAPGPSHRRPGRALAAGLGWSSQ